MTHPTEGALMRWIDGEADRDETVAVSAHVAHCPACAVALANLRRQDGLWRDAVRLLDDAATIPAHGGRRLIWAAALLLLGLGAGVPPVRAWFVAQGRALLAAARDDPARPVPIVPVEPRQVSRVQFMPTPGPFEVQVATLQAGGMLVITRADGPAASAWMEGDPIDASLVVLPQGLRILNGSGASASYHLEVPGGSAPVTVRVGPRLVRVTPPAEVMVGRSGASRTLQGQEERP